MCLNTNESHKQAYCRAFGFLGSALLSIWLEAFHCDTHTNRNAIFTVGQQEGRSYFIMTLTLTCTDDVKLTQGTNTGLKRHNTSIKR